MLKEIGELAEAETVYHEALSQSPNDGDIHLQLGHALKLQGRIPAAIAAYRRAAELLPMPVHPLRELAYLGDLGAQQSLFEAQVRQGGVDALLTLTHKVVELRDTLDQMVASLPNLQAQAAVPVTSYTVFRKLYCLPAAPKTVEQPSYHVLLLADREDMNRLRSQISAIERQSYQNWKLSIVTGEPGRRRIAAEAAARDARISVIPNLSDGRQGTAALPNTELASLEARAASNCVADWILLLAQGALVHPEAIAWFAAVAARTGADAFVCDTEYVSERDGAVQYDTAELLAVPDYDTLLERNVLGETLVVKHRPYTELIGPSETDTPSIARSLLLLGLAKDSRIGHVPLPLVSRSTEQSLDQSVSDWEHRRAVERHLTAALADTDRIRPIAASTMGEAAIRWPIGDTRAAIAAIIPTRDNGTDLRQAVISLRETAIAPERLQFVLVDNGSREASTAAIIEELRTDATVSVLRLDEPFNWSRLSNEGANTSDAPILLFVNDDVTMLTSGWDDRVRELLGRPDIGAVGARLLYPDETLQHGGILFNWSSGLVIHDGLYEDKSTLGPGSRWQVTRAVSAVTGAFLATRRDSFVAQGGFDAVELPVAYSDIDYALKLRRAGLKILWTPSITAYHHEAKTRGLDHLDPEKKSRNAAERAVMQRRWGAALSIEPSINPLWYRETMPFRLLSPSSDARLWAHIQRCAAANPWLVVDGPNGARDAAVPKLQLYSPDTSG